MSLRRFAPLLFALVACGPSNERPCDGTTDTTNDRDNCGFCGNACGDGEACVASQCMLGACNPGETGECYSGQDGTADVGPCEKGTHTCEATGTWSQCMGEVVPTGEICGDGIDQNCNGTADEDVDADGDGYTTCGGDCCDSTECGSPALVNPGAFDAAGNLVDDDCNGALDDTPLICDQGLASGTTNAMDFAKAIDICQVATEQDRKWGVISAGMSLTTGTGTPDPRGYSIRPKFGTNLQPMGGVSLAVLSTGAAAAKGDMNPAYNNSTTLTHSSPNTSAFPADFLAANGGDLPNAPGCPDPDGSTANDPEMLTLRVRVPSNAHSFKVSSTFYSYEFPEYTCSPYNDFFVILLDSTYTGTNANPTDKNLAFYTPMGTMDKVPVGVNLGHGDTGLFTQCKNGQTGCSGEPGSISTCLSTEQLIGTGFDNPSSQCDSGQFAGGATGWLTTTGNVVPGEIITLRIAIWDTSDTALDSTAVIDGFQWSTELSNPGTVIGRTF